MSYGKMSQTLTILSNVNEKKPSALQKMRRITFLVISILVNFQTYSLLKADYTTNSFFFEISGISEKVNIQTERILIHSLMCIF